jgi:hypothetical protein
VEIKTACSKDTGVGINKNDTSKSSVSEDGIIKG